MSSVLFFEKSLVILSKEDAFKSSSFQYLEPFTIPMEIDRLGPMPPQSLFSTAALSGLALLKFEVKLPFRRAQVEPFHGLRHTCAGS
jgi:hypothetical protein